MGIRSSKNTGKLRGCLILMRPANLPTAAADILTGAVVAGAIYITSPELGTVHMLVSLLLLVAASICLYAGGVVLNDVFDLKLDRIERPERPIPSGTVSLSMAIRLGSALLVLGIIFALLVSFKAALVALFLAFAILLYDSLAKHHVFFGPLVMGSCRGLNLLLGMFLFGIPPTHLWIYLLLPVIYIAAVTLVSRGEVHGRNRDNIALSGFLYAVVMALILILMPKSPLNWAYVLPFLILFAVAVYRPLITAYRINSPQNIKKAVKAGVLSLVLMDATMAVSASIWWVGVIIILLLPVSLFLAKRFSVT